MKYEIYTDGSCLGNPGRGGLGAVVYLNGVENYTFSQGFEYTTNNRMELLAVITVLEKYGDQEDIEIWTDSMYVKDGITRWLKSWKEKGWKKADGKGIKNKDLWEKLDSVNRLHIKYNWIKGHSNEVGNETADALAVMASNRGPFIKDEGYKFKKENE